MRILLATDGSGSAGAALDFLLGFPFPAGSEAIVLSVIDGKTFTEDKLASIYDLNVTMVASLTEQTRASLDVLTKALTSYLNIARETAEDAAATKVVREAGLSVRLDPGPFASVKGAQQVDAPLAHLHQLRPT